MAEVPQKSLERYDVLDRIAVGGMAEVFLAKAYGAHGFEKTLAIKRILPELARDPEFEERFIAEAKLAVKLSHTNVVQVFDFGRFAGSLFIAMEYVDGLDLAAMLRRFKERHERVPLPAAFQIAIELARGLDFAHTHGVVHRDVSPSNILLSKAGEVKIADFGIAVAAQPVKGPAGAARRKVMGKWRYMSPEQARGEQLDTRSDMFSAAAVMYELFTGEKLFPGDEAEDILRNIHEMQLPRASETRRGLPARLDEILHQALARRPGDRPPRPAVLLRALTELTYESSIVTTTLDVADAVRYVVDLTTPTGKRLDDIIRAQLAGVAESSVVRQTARGERRTSGAGGDAPGMPLAIGAASDRRTAEGSAPHDLERLTAVTVARRKRRTGSEDAIDDGDAAAAAPAPAAIDSSGEHDVLPPIEGVPVLMTRIDSDGISRLEVDETTVTVAPWELASEGKDKTPGRTGGPGVPKRGPKVTAASGSIPPGRIAPLPSPDIEPPAPGEDTIHPTTSLTDLKPLTLTPVTHTTQAPTGSGRRRTALIGLAAAVVLGVGALWIANRGAGERAPEIVPIAVVDAAPAKPVVQPAIITVVTVPAGAKGTAGSRSFGPTPATFEVEPGPAALRIELAGYEPYIDASLKVTPGQSVGLHIALNPARARLAVESEPLDVDVSLDGEDLGRTPLSVKDLTPRKNGRLRLSKTGFVPLTVPVELIGGEEVRVFRALRPAPTPSGSITINVVDSWGEVYLAGKKIGEAGLGARAITLPVGKHKLKVVNPQTSKSATIDVEVRADRVLNYSVSLS